MDIYIAWANVCCARIYIIVFNPIGFIWIKKTKFKKEFLNFVKGGIEFSVILHDAYYSQTLNFFLSSKDTKLSFIDMSLVVLSKKYKIVTFDKVLKRKLLKSND